MNRMTLSLMILSLGLLAAPEWGSADTIYRWVDKNGTVHFGETPPEGVDARPVEGNISTVKVPQSQVTPPAGESAGAGAANPEEPTKSLAQQRREERATARAEAEAAKAALDVQCKSMQQQLAWTEPNPRVIVQDADGTTRRMDDDERLKLVNEAKDFLANNDCD